MKRKFINPFAGLLVSGRRSDSFVQFTTENLFTENNPHGYFSRQQLIDYVSGISEYQQQKLVMFFEYVAEKHSITSLPIPVDDEYGNSILWVKFSKNGNKQSFRLFSTDWLIQFVTDAKDGKLHGFEFSAEALSEELKKIQQ
jgi:hypothetical protein